MENTHDIPLAEKSNCGYLSIEKADVIHIFHKGAVEINFYGRLKHRNPQKNATFLHLIPYVIHNRLDPYIGLREFLYFLARMQHGGVVLLVERIPYLLKAVVKRFSG